MEFQSKFVDHVLEHFLREFEVVPASVDGFVEDGLFFRVVHVVEVLVFQTLLDCVS